MLVQTLKSIFSGGRLKSHRILSSLFSDGSPKGLPLQMVWQVVPAKRRGTIARRCTYELSHTQLVTEIQVRAQADQSRTRVNLSYSCRTKLGNRNGTINIKVCLQMSESCAGTSKVLSSLANLINQQVLVLLIGWSQN